MAKTVRRDGCVRSAAAEDAAEGEYRAEESRGRTDAGQSHVEGCERKKVVSLVERQRAANYLQDDYSVSERHACRVLTLHRNTKRSYEHKTFENALDQEILRLSHQEPRWGYRKVHDRMKLDTYQVGRERVRRLRAREGLQVRRKQHKKRHLGPTLPLRQAVRPNHVWTYDFVMDRTIEGRRLKCLTIADEFSRLGLAIECARSITAADVQQILKALFAAHGRPDYLRSDNGPEFIAEELRTWLAAESVNTQYIKPGSPWQNGFGESFNAMFRDDCLNRWEFMNLPEARVISNQWLDKYNDYRPHGSLNGLTPNLFLARWQTVNGRKAA